MFTPAFSRHRSSSTRVFAHDSGPYRHMANRCARARYHRAANRRFTGSAIRAVVYRQNLWCQRRDEVYARKRRSPDAANVAEKHACCCAYQLPGVQRRPVQQHFALKPRSTSQIRTFSGGPLPPRTVGSLPLPSAQRGALPFTAGSVEWPCSLISNRPYLGKPRHFNRGRRCTRERGFHHVGDGRQQCCLPFLENIALRHSTLGMCQLRFRCSYHRSPWIRMPLF